MSVDTVWSHVGSRRIFARKWGSPNEHVPPAVGVHGLVVSGSYFEPTADLLEGDLTFWAPDQPGFGHSDPPPKTLTVGELADELIQWFHAVSIQKASLVANSFGCQVAAEVAVRRPDLVDRMVLASPTLDPSARTVGHLLKRWVQESKTQSWPLRRLLVAEYARAGVTRAVGTIRQLLTDRIEDKLPFIDLPTLVVRGTDDPICPQQWAQTVTELLPRAELLTVQGAPHAMNFDAPTEFVEAIRPFLMEASREVKQ